MTTLREAAKKALKSLEDAIRDWTDEMEFRSCVSVADSWSESAAALRVALADQSEQALGMVNPVAWLGFNPRTGAPELANAMPAPSVMRDFKMRPLVYGDTSISPQRKPIDAKTLWEMWVESPSDVLRFARAIERAHGIEGEK
jgi:hypothetical protein